MKIFLFLGTFTCTILSTLWFSDLFPGGDQYVKIIWATLALLISVVVVCTKMLIEKLDELKDTKVIQMDGDNQ